MIILTELQKEKTCACIQIQINTFSKRIDEINRCNRPITDEENEEQMNCQKAIDFYTQIILAITQG